MPTDREVTSPRASSDVLVDLLRASLGDTPDATAVVSGSERLTYEALDRRARMLAGVLVAHGVGPDELVGLFLPRNSDLPASLLGTWFAGGAYVPLDPEYPPDRIDYMARDAGLRAVVTTRDLADRLPRIQAPTVLVDELPDRTEPLDESRLGCDGAEHLAYVIYTSGSTGRPKGVEVTRGAVTNFLESMAHIPGLDASDRFAAVTTLSFDISVLELFLPLVVGATAIVLDSETVTDGSALSETLDREVATAMQATPATWRMLLEAGWTPRQRFKALCGGEALPPDLARQLAGTMHEAWNMYGPTETTVWSTCYRLPKTGAPVLIGRPIKNTKVFVLDSGLNPVPPGVQGEIWIGGAGLARGYRNMPERTEEAFRTSPFAAGERIYRTGDLGRSLASGELEHRGRADSQVKVRGFRIELGEIEAGLARDERVKAAAVTLDRTDPNDPRIVAYYVPKRGETPRPQELRDALRNWLPSHMIPQFFVPLSELPLTPNNKVDRRRLPMLVDVAVERGPSDFVEPRNHWEAKVVEAWQDVLPLATVSADANFFDLGGHSILGIRVIARLRRDLGVDITLRDFFDGPSVDRLARRLEDLSAAAAKDDAIEQLVL